jgi:hypothetical protein
MVLVKNSRHWLNLANKVLAGGIFFDLKRGIFSKKGALERIFVYNILEINVFLVNDVFLSDAAIFLYKK